MTQTKIIKKIVFISLMLFVTVGCHVETVKPEEITIQGVYYKDTGHPFSGPAIMAKGGYYRLTGAKAQKLNLLGDATKIKVRGKLFTTKRTIPESGRLREISEKVIEVQSFEVIK